MRTGPWLLALALLAAPAAARANVFDQFGFEPRGTAMGGAQTASGENHVAAYFNPSLLVLQRDVSFGFGVSWAQPSTQIQTQSLGDAARLRTGGNPPDYGGFTLGVLFPLGGKVQNRLALGLGLYVPTNNFLRTEAGERNEPFWYFYQSKPDRMILSAGAGVRVFDWLQVGGGVQFLGAFLGGFQFKVNLFNQEFERASVKNDLVLHTSPLAGLTLNFEKIGLRGAFGYRAPIYLDYDMPTKFEIAEVGLININMKGVVHYSPHIFTLALQYAVGPVIASAELRYALWSRAPDPYVHVNMTTESDVLAALGAEGRFDADSGERPPGFKDTLEPHVGVEYWIVPRFAVRLGYSFRPTPVPLQTGDTNILDGDTHAFAAGIGFSFHEPLEIFTKPVHIDLAYQFLLIPERRADKAAAGEVPAYVYSGHANHVTAAVRYIF